ncbi:hypothetical protein ISCGN_009288 [Ixodes scapularis]
MTKHKAHSRSGCFCAGNKVRWPGSVAKSPSANNTTSKTRPPQDVIVSGTRPKNALDEKRRKAADASVWASPRVSVGLVALSTTLTRGKRHCVDPLAMTFGGERRGPFLPGGIAAKPAQGYREATKRTTRAPRLTDRTME